MKFNPFFIFLMIFFARIIFAGNVFIENNSSYPVICFYGDSHKTHINTLRHAAKQFILPGDSIDLILSDEKNSTIYAYRIPADDLTTLFGNITDAVIIDGKPDFSKINLNFSQWLDQEFAEASLKKLIRAIVANQSPIRYLEVKKEDLNAEKTILIEDQKNSDTIAPLIIGTKKQIEAQAEEADSSATYKLTISNKSKFPVLVAYGPQTWEQGLVGKARLDLKLAWWKESAKWVIDAEKEGDIFLDSNKNNKIFFYRISLEEEIKNAKYILEKIATSTAKKAAINTILPGSTLIRNVSKLFSLYSVIERTKEKMPFVTTTLTPDMMSNCSKLKIDTSPNQTSIICDIN